MKNVAEIVGIHWNCGEVEYTHHCGIEDARKIFHTLLGKAMKSGSKLGNIGYISKPLDIEEK